MRTCAMPPCTGNSARNHHIECDANLTRESEIAIRPTPDLPSFWWAAWRYRPSITDRPPICSAPCKTCRSRLDRLDDCCEHGHRRWMHENLRAARFSCRVDALPTLVTQPSPDGVACCPAISATLRRLRRVTPQRSEPIALWLLTHDISNARRIA